MRLIRILAPVALAIGFTVSPAAAQKGATLKKDTAAIMACLKQVDDEVEKYEKLSEKAREKADPPAEASSCIGVVSTACQEKIKGDANKGLATCNNREQAVWNAHLQERLADYMKEAKPNEQAAMKKVQASWQGYMEARCGFAVLDNDDKGLAAALASACLLEQMAQRALWVDTREN